MIKPIRSKKIYIITFSLVAVPILLLAAGVCWQARQETLDQSLLNGLQKRNALLVKAAVEAGADPNARFLLSEQPPLAERIKDLLRKFRGSHGAAAQPFVPAILVAFPYENKPPPWDILPDEPSAVSRVDDTDVMTAMLLASGADANAVDKFGDTALHHAVIEERIALVKKLLEYGADPNRKNSKGTTPLMFASLETGKLLMQRNANVNITDEKGMTAFHYALGRPDQEFACYLLDHGCILGKAEKLARPDFHNACLWNLGIVVQHIIDKKGDINCVDSNGDTILHLAVSCDVEPQIVRKLLDAGADITKKDKLGKTPLQLAKSYDKKPLIQLYQEHEAKKMTQEE